MQSDTVARQQAGLLTPESRRLAVSGWPIKPAIASVVVLAMVVLAVVIISQGWRGARQAMLQSAATTARDAGLLITEKSKRMLEPAQATLHLLATDPIADATTFEARIQRLGTLANVLASNRLASAIYIGYDDGSFLLVRPLDSQDMRKRFDAPPDARFLVQSIEVKPGGEKVGQFLLYNGARSLIERRMKDNYLFDPRTRPWFQSIQKTDISLSSEPYVFFTTEQVGLTLSQAASNGHAVFGIDVVLDDLGSSLAGLKISPNTELALVDSQQKVLAYQDMGRVLVKSQERFEFKTVEALGVASLIRLNALQTKIGDVASFDADGKEWIGVAMPFDVWAGKEMRLLVAAPSDELLGELRQSARHLALWVVGLTLLLMPLGWWSGAAIGASLDQLTVQARRMRRFDFGGTAAKPTRVREVNALARVVSDLGQTMQSFLQISQDMATEPKVERMLDNALRQMVSATRCTAGVVYLAGAKGGPMHRAAAVGSLHEHRELTLAYPAPDGSSALRREIAPGVVELLFELRGRRGVLDGLLVLQRPARAGQADSSFTEFVQKLSGMLAVSIETRQLIEAQQQLLDAVIRLMADAIDAKSPYTGGHCERVPELAGAIIDRMRQDTSGPYAQFSMSEEERYEFHLGAWLHDCGKVTSPEHIIDKATKLETIYNRIHEIRTRFEVLWRDAELAHWQAVAEGGDAAAQQAALVARRQVLQDDFAFIARCNVGTEFMAEADLERLQLLARTPWTRHFDNTLGLSAEEARRLDPAQRSLPAQESLLADRADQVVPWGERRPAVERGDPKNQHEFDMVLPKVAQNMGELHNLSIRRGTLTPEDRFRINDHIVQTLVMLRSLPWPAALARVPHIAATHHEKLDGNGYPRRLGADQLSTPDRVMALADIFEALTAPDRPYKAAKTLTESLKIMAKLAADQHLDAQLFRYFLHSGIWRSFANRYMKPEQIDPVDLAAIEALVPEQVPLL